MKYLLLVALSLSAPLAQAACEPDFAAEGTALNAFAARTAQVDRASLEGKIDRVEALPSLENDQTRWYVAVSAKDGAPSERYSFSLSKNCELIRSSFAVLASGEAAK